MPLGQAGARDFQRVASVVGSAVLTAGTPSESGTAGRLRSFWRETRPFDQLDCGFSLFGRGRNLSIRHLGCRCCTTFRQSSTGGDVITATLPRRHCLKSTLETKQKSFVTSGRTDVRTDVRGVRMGGLTVG